MWKPGQCVTINGERYRVKKDPKGGAFACRICDFRGELCFRKWRTECFPKLDKEYPLGPDCFLVHIPKKRRKYDHE